MAKKTISNTFTVSTLIDGESVFDASLDHNVIGVECDTEGNISETVSFLVTISAHYGSENVVGACSITDNHEDVDSDISVEYDPSHTSEPWVAQITFTQGNALASMLNIAFTITHPTYGTRVVALAINRVVLGKDGTNAPFYNEEWYAWSNVASTANTTTSPFTEPYSGWKTFIPEQGSLSYLWKKIIRYDYNASTKQYVASNAQYYRMSGTNGTSIHTRGQVANASSRGSGTATIITDSGTETINLSDGDAVTQLDNGHLYQWVTEGGGKWIDLGQFKGESGVTYYTHIAWAASVVLSQSPLPIPAGQQNTPNATSVSGGVIVPSGADLPWMGYLIDTNASDSTTFTNYTWSKTKGAKGDAAVVYKIELEKSVFSYNPNKTSNNLTIDIKGKVRRIEGSTSSIFDLNYGNIMTYRVTKSGESLVISSISLDDTFSCNITTNYNDDIAFKISFRINGVEQSVESIPLVDNGERGKLGRFYYYSGFDWDASNENDTFVVNDAQVPWFSKAGRNANKNYVFNPETIPASGQMTMAQMAATTTVSGQIQWNKAPWEVMTDDFKYLITQAIFGAYAHLGSWIFNNDYMLSEKDKDGVPRGQRTYNGMDDNQLTTGFIPSIAFDALNGRASFGGDTVRFQPDGSGWLANKSIIWDEDGNASFSGFIKKTPTHITPENESEYIINYFSTLYTFDFQKTGTFVVLQPNVSCDTLHLPCLYQNVAHYYSDEQKMIIRGYVGTKILIYNVSGHGLTIYYMYNSNGGSYSDVLGNGSCATAECKIRTESGIENVYWEFVHCGYIL